MDIIWTLICGQNSEEILFCTAHGLPGWAAHTCDITKKLWAESTMEELSCSTAGEETWILLPPLDFHLPWASGSQRPCWGAWRRTLLLQFLYLFCPRKALTRGRRSCKEKTFGTSDVLVESLWSVPVPLPRITAPVMYISPLSPRLQLPMIFPLILGDLMCFPRHYIMSGDFPVLFLNSIFLSHQGLQKLEYVACFNQDFKWQEQKQSFVSFVFLVLNFLYCPSWPQPLALASWMLMR